MPEGASMRRAFLIAMLAVATAAAMATGPVPAASSARAPTTWEREEGSVTAGRPDALRLSDPMIKLLTNERLRSIPARPSTSAR